MYNKYCNPFGEDNPSNINIDKLAEEMAETLKKLNASKAVSGEKNEVSDNSVGSLSQAMKMPVM
jgi:hypothetical protein